MASKKFKDLAQPLYESAESRGRMADIRAEMEGELIAHHLGELRRALGVDQIELAERLGMTQGGLSRLERSADPKLSTLRKLTAALGGTLRIEVAVGDRVFQLAPG